MIVRNFVGGVSPERTVCVCVFGGAYSNSNMRDVRGDVGGETQQPEEEAETKKKWKDIK